MEVLAYLIPLALFAGVYASLYIRAKRRGEAPVVQARWPAAILLLAGAAILLGVFL